MNKFAEFFLSDAFGYAGGLIFGSNYSA